VPSDAWREPLPILTGKAWAFGLDVTAALVLAPEWRGATDLGRHLLTSVDPDFPARVARGDFVVAGNDFAAGTEDDSGVRALVAAGIGAVIAYSFDPRFAEHALAHALPVASVNEALAIHTGARLRVDLEGARVANLSSGDRYPIRNLSEDVLARLRARRA